MCGIAGIPRRVCSTRYFCIADICPAVCLGLTNGAGAHTPGEYIYTKPLAAGLASLVAVVEAVFDELVSPTLKQGL